MLSHRSVYFLLFFSFLISACNRSYVPVKTEYNDYTVTAAIGIDSTLLRSLQPYRDSVNFKMNEVVGIADVVLERKKPESTLGNFMADAMYYGAVQKFGEPVDIAVVNYGGVRLNEVRKGPVTQGQIFELMPFDNLLILQKIRGDSLQSFFDLIAADGGWPIAGVTMHIQNGKAINVQIGGKPLDKNKIYTVANSDYIANGNGAAVMLKNIAQENKGYLMRDAIFDYIKALKSSGKNIAATLQNRITND